MASGQGPGPPRRECGEAAPSSTSEEQVARDTEEVFRSYVFYRHRQEQEAEGAAVPADPEMVTLPLEPSSLFESGINWGRVVALLGFGYRLALHVYQRGLTGFLGQVTRFVADFMLHHCIARWIAQRGGWVAALNLGNGPILNVLIVLSVVLLGQFVPTGLGERREKFMIKPNAGSGCRWSPLTSPHPLSVSENKL
ncbi:bcl-2 homologous antagonist/killer isoform X3 [Vulpes vulpes]|uniref:Bcl-2 homologous antagonist/killer isoform X3 n=1 Tax=Vulpes vulpes TaxID=9627 RepID=A0ABM4Y7A0_VULVU|nr:bcl-2 homologous antagonist/killer isoform X3 [Vulpes lagopus]|eukprot:XP_022281445.1 bcl-2 homologous antagonist/killer isoform X3 [Canis lupus familiaris]